MGSPMVVLDCDSLTASDSVAPERVEVLDFPFFFFLFLGLLGLVAFGLLFAASRSLGGLVRLVVLSGE